ncbi:MAG: cytochrome c-type biogenesis protein CcmH [Chloroflexi bacterium]|nr:cytochrome c-type biogenesis protein CcmH [Chloroflexota bacterium]
MKDRLRIMKYVITIILLLLTAGVVSAQTREVTDDEVNEIAKDLFCPVCESTPLDVCPTKACADWRELIRTQLAEGKSQDEVFDYFARQYGDGVLADPPKRGFNLILWMFPIVAVLVGGGLFARYIFRLRSETNVTPATAAAAKADQQTLQQLINPADAKSEYIARIEDELLGRK